MQIPNTTLKCVNAEWDLYDETDITDEDDI